ncbi:MAG: DUF2887 domain-containing protein [Acidobacteriota bacterium]|nr:DUF2887 domain-containing protein [Acidobacteriota bacterium]
MRTDELIYEYFKARPNDLFRLIGQKVEGSYIYESITVKTTEKRLDGFLYRIDAEGIRTFFEAQGYLDQKIYWRLGRTAFTWHEINEFEGPWQMVFLFLKASYDPGLPEELTPLEKAEPPLIRRYCIEDCLKRLGDNAGELTVLKPLVTKNRKEFDRNIGTWQTQIKELDLTEERTQMLGDLLIFAVMQRFSEFTFEELRKMINFIPREDSVAFQELKAIGRKEGRKEGRIEGKLIGSIQVFQDLRGLPVQSSEDLEKLSIDELRQLHDRLKLTQQNLASR